MDLGNNNHDVALMEANYDSGGGEAEGEGGGDRGHHGKKSKKLPNFQVYSVAVNLIIGVGVLDLPQVFHDSGMLLCIVLVIIAAVAADLTANYLAHTHAKAVIMESEKPQNQRKEGQEPFETTFQVSVLCEMFLGPWFKRFYTFCLYLYTTGSLWGYCAVFSQQAASLVVPFIVDSGNSTTNQTSFCLQKGQLDSECQYVYWGFLAVYGVCQLIMTIVGIEELAVFQAILTIYRFAALGVMALLAVVGLGLSKSLDGQATNPTYTTVEWGALPSTIPSLVFSQLMHMGVPDVVKPIKRLKSAPCLFHSTFATTASTYMVMSLVLAVYMGSSILSPVTLNFNSFTGFQSQDTYENSGAGTKIWVQTIKYFIVLFPCLDLFSAFSLNAIVLAHNIAELFPEKAALWFGRRPRKASSKAPKDETQLQRGFDRIQTLCSVFVASVPIVLAFFIHNLVKIVSVTGIFGTLLMFGFPGLLHWKSSEEFNDVSGSNNSVEERQAKMPHQTKSAFTKCMFSPTMGLVVVAASIGLLGISISALFLGNPPVASNYTF